MVELSNGVDGSNGGEVESEAERWLRESRSELAELLLGEQRDDEAVFQRWLEQHPAFVPGARGAGGNSGHDPWPGALITQPRLTGIIGKVPDFCWLATDSAELTAVFVEIETPAKRWQQREKAVQSAELTQALEQINAWRAWFNRPQNQSVFLDDYLVPDLLTSRQFSQRYILVHGSRSEYASDVERERQRASSIRGADFEAMSFDRLLGLASTWASRFACVHREGSEFRAVAVPPIWKPGLVNPDGVQRTSGYEDVLVESGMPENRREAVLAELEEIRSRETSPPRYFP
ncbi:MAG TPA: Shedu anti-phage system protein SduA domain-containing protein [Solirubrobacterales bacterium]|nr:Shedu anti-phage system protein SduA domain-containing protein [Solirubrobacterales bacterium]